MDEITEVRAVYNQLLDTWNSQSARGMAGLFTEDGESIGFDIGHPGSDKTSPIQDRVYKNIVFL